MVAKKVIVCIDRFDAKDGRIWAVRTRGKWFTARRVQIGIAMETVFRGRDAMQPKAYLQGIGVVRAYGDGTITIAAA